MGLLPRLGAANTTVQRAAEVTSGTESGIWLYLFSNQADFTSFSSKPRVVWCCRSKPEAVSQSRGRANAAPSNLCQRRGLPLRRFLLGRSLVIWPYLGRIWSK